MHSINLQVHGKPLVFHVLIWKGHVHWPYICQVHEYFCHVQQSGHEFIDNIGTMSSSHEHVYISNTRLCPGIVPWFDELYGAMVSEHAISC